MSTAPRLAPYIATYAQRTHPPPSLWSLVVSLYPSTPLWSRLYSGFAPGNSISGRMLPEDLPNLIVRLSVSDLPPAVIKLRTDCAVSGFSFDPLVIQLHTLFPSNHTQLPLTALRLALAAFPPFPARPHPLLAKSYPDLGTVICRPTLPLPVAIYISMCNTSTATWRRSLDNSRYRGCPTRQGLAPITPPPPPPPPKVLPGIQKLSHGALRHTQGSS